MKWQTAWYGLATPIGMCVFFLGRKILFSPEETIIASAGKKDSIGRVVL